MSPASRTWAALPFCVLCSVGVGCGGSGTLSGTTTPAPVPTSTCQTEASSSVPVPTGCVYFGAWANPAQSGTVEANAETLEAQLGQKLRLHMHYYGWGSGTTPSFPDAAMQADQTAPLGVRIPVVTWACGDTDANVIAGNDDTLLINTAQAVKAFGSPVYIRWYWEMNLAAGTNGQNCLGTLGATGYQQAWQHIWTIFQKQGVTNVSWLWNPAGATADPDSSGYYPGDAYVDWIGFDGYDKVTAYDFGPIFRPFYSEFSGHGKPILIAETGECQGKQDVYLASAIAEIASRTNAGGYAFPLVKGFMYFDAPGHYAPCVWNFDTAGNTQFAAMGNDSYFEAGK